MTPQSWNNILAPTVGWKTAYAAVEEEVRRVFSSEHATGKLTTSLLVELLYPQAEARGPAGLAARARLFTALAALADHGLKSYWELDTPRPMKRNPAKTIRPKLWRQPEATPDYLPIELRAAIVELEQANGMVSRAAVAEAWERINILLEAVARRKPE